jgi:hypothetical protein
VAFEAEFTDEAEEHLAALNAGERASLIAAIEAHLLHQPTVETRNRKRMRANPLAPWVLRVGHPRVYYEVRRKPDDLVTVRAIGIKHRDRVTVAGEEVDLS